MDGTCKSVLWARVLSEPRKPKRSWEPRGGSAGRRFRKGVLRDELRMKNPRSEATDQKTEPSEDLNCCPGLQWQGYFGFGIF